MTIAYVRLAAAAAAALIIAGCGSSDSSNTSTSTSSSAAPTTAATAMTSGSSTMTGKTTAAAPIPPDLKCSDTIVWVNLSSKAYHLPDDKYYGRSKHGVYMCRSTADSKGYHLAGTGHAHSTGTESPAPDAT